MNLSRDWGQSAIHIRDFFEILKIICQAVKILPQERQILTFGSGNALNTSHLTVAALFFALPVARRKCFDGSHTCYAKKLFQGLFHTPFLNDAIRSGADHRNVTMSALHGKLSAII